MAMPLSKERLLSWPSDLLLSLLNQQLRDEFDSLQALARYHDLPLNTLHERLEDLGLHYDTSTNQIKG